MKPTPFLLILLAFFSLNAYCQKADAFLDELNAGFQTYLPNRYYTNFEKKNRATGGGLGIHLEATKRINQSKFFYAVNLKSSLMSVNTDWHIFPYQSMTSVSPMLKYRFGSIGILGIGLNTTHISTAKDFINLGYEGSIGMKVKCFQLSLNYASTFTELEDQHNKSRLFTDKNFDNRFFYLAVGIDYLALFR